MSLRLETYVGLGTISTPPTILRDEEWHHVAVSVGETSQFFAIDGEIVTSFHENTTFLTVGKTIFVGNVFPYDRWIDELRFWNIPRSLEDIRKSMRRTLRGSEINSDLELYYNFDREPGQRNLLVLDRTGKNHPLTLGYENIGSNEEENQYYLRSAPPFVSSDAPFRESPFYVKIGRPYGATEANFKLVTLPIEADDEVIITVKTLPHTDISLKFPNGTLISEVPTEIEGKQLIISMAHPDVFPPLDTGFEYTARTSSKSSGIGSVMIRLFPEQPPAPGGPGHSLKCGGFLFPSPLPLFPHFFLSFPLFPSLNHIVSLKVLASVSRRISFLVLILKRTAPNHTLSNCGLTIFTLQ